MTRRITVRLNERLEKLIDTLKNKDIINLSALIRKGLEAELNKISCIDNSRVVTGLKKDDKKQGN